MNSLRGDTRLATTLGAVLAAIVVVGVRFYRLDDVPSEWYGDISTIYEHAMGVRNGYFPPGLYVLGVGPLYASSVAAFYAVFPSTYYLMKLISVLWSLAGLWALFVLCRRLQGAAFAALATVVAGTGFWLLLYSRLGDVQAAVPVIAIGSLALVARIVESRPRSVLPAVLCGVTTGASLYCYGAAFAVPLLITAALVWLWAVMPPPRFAMRHLWIYASSLVLTLVPLALSFGSKEALVGGHIGVRTVRENVVATVLSHFGTALSGYVVSRSPYLPQVDRLGLALAIVGCVYWLMPKRWRWGVVLIGGFLLMHLPAAMAIEGGTINGGRTIAAMPFLHILIASGLWAIGAVVRRWRTTPAVVVVGVLLVALVGINLHRYFRLYPRALPYANAAIAGAITRYVDPLPPPTGVYLIGSTWSEGKPEPKSIRYTMRHPDAFSEIYVDDFDCERLGKIERPAVLLWSPQNALPSPGVSDCAAELTPELHSSPSGLPLFNSTWLRSEG